MFSFSRLPIRRIAGKRDGVFLTFDDGPHPELTPQLLRLLAELQVKATFFVVGREVDAHLDVAREIVRAGHAIGNHTYDHDYLHYLRGEVHLREWVTRSNEHLCEKLGVAPVGFRPPAGVLTPPLVRAVKKLRYPLILWNHRFFDTRYPLTTQSVSRAVKRTENGDIFLLHDGNSRDPAALLNGVRSLVLGLRAQKKECSPLSSHDFV